MVATGIDASAGEETTGMDCDVVGVAYMVGERVVSGVAVYDAVRSCLNLSTSCSKDSTYS